MANLKTVTHSLMPLHYCLFLYITSLATPNVMAQTPLQPRAYYLNSSGSDSNNGTKDQPWKTIQKINETQFHPGDTISFKAGQVFKGTIRLTGKNRGALQMPILLTSYDTGKAVIDGSNESAIQFENTSFITINRLSLVGNGRKNGNTADGLSILGCSNIIAGDLDISGFRNAGLLVHTSSYVHVTAVNAHDNGFAGISISGLFQQKESCHDIYIGYSRAENNPGSPAILDNHSGNGIIAGNCSKVVIEYCTATNNGWDMPRTGNGPVGIWCYEADSITIQHCISYRNKTSPGADDGGGFDLDGGVTNSVIQYCLSYENQGSAFGLFQYAGASVWYNNTVRFNISENDGGVSAANASFYIWNSTGDSTQLSTCFIYNNTIYNSRGAAIHFAGQSERKAFHFFNNIFVAADSLLKGAPANDFFLGNNWWCLKGKFKAGRFNNLREWAAHYNQEMIRGKLAGSNIDPGFTKRINRVIAAANLQSSRQYRVPNSPVWRRGINVEKLAPIEAGGIDFNGKPAPLKGIGASF